MSQPAYLEGWLYVPVAYLGAERVKGLCRTLTFTPKRFHRDQVVEPVHLYDTSRPGYIGLPVDWGIRTFPDLKFQDRTVMGGELVAHTRPDPFHPRAAAGQDTFMSDCLSAAHANYAFFAVAPTGSGKTVTALNTAAELGRRTIAMAPTVKLCDQWIEECHQHLGIPYKRIGMVQQDRFDYEGKDFVAGVMHSVGGRTYPAEFYRAFGTAIWDEVDVVGAPLFASTLGRFPAAYKMAFTATWKRKDNQHRVYIHYFGDRQVEAEVEALPMTVHVLDYYPRTPTWGRERGAIIKCLSQDRHRNELLVAIIRKLYRNGRNVLVIGEKIEHLQLVMDMARRSGIPDEEMGQFTGSSHDVQCTLVGGKEVKRKVTAKVTDEYLDWAKAHARVVFATYGMMKRGIDIARLDAGVDITPVSEATQTVGRVRRKLEGKPRPLWYTLRDVTVEQALRWYKGRKRDYLTSNCEVIEHGEA